MFRYWDWKITALRLWHGFLYAAAFAAVDEAIRRGWIAETGRTQYLSFIVMALGIDMAGLARFGFKVRAASVGADEGSEESR